jgi:hypothetical protein
VLAPNAKLRALVVPQGPEPAAQAAQPTECEANCAHQRPVRLSWARLLKHVVEIDLEHCPNCGGELKIMAAILEQPVIEKILMHLGLQARAATLRCPRSSAASGLTSLIHHTVHVARCPGPRVSAASALLKALQLRSNSQGKPTALPAGTHL